MDLKSCAAGTPQTKPETVRLIASNYLPSIRTTSPNQTATICSRFVVDRAYSALDAIKSSSFLGYKFQQQSLADLIQAPRRVLVSEAGSNSID